MIGVLGRQYIRAAIMALSSNMVAMCAALLSVALSVRHYSKQDIGALFLMLAFSQVAATIGSLGLRTTVVSEISSTPLVSREAISRAFVSVALFAALLSASIMMIVEWSIIKQWDDPGAVSLLWAAPVLSALFCLYWSFLSLLAANKNFRGAAIATGVNEIVRLGATVIAISLIKPVAYLVGAMVAGKIVAIIIAAWHLGRFSVPSIKFNPSLINMAPAGWVYANSVTGLVLLKIPDILLGFFGGSAAVAVFATARQVPSLAKKLFEAMRVTILRFILESDETKKHGEGVMLAIGAQLVVGTCALGLASAGIMTSLLFGSAYLDAVPVMRLLLVWVCLSVITGYIALVMLGRGKPRATFTVLLPQLLIVVGVGPYMMQAYAEIGAAWAIVLGAAVGVIVSLLTIRGFPGVNVALMIRDVGIPVAVLCCCAAAYWFISGSAAAVLSIVVAGIYCGRAVLDLRYIGRRREGNK